MADIQRTINDRMAMTEDVIVIVKPHWPTKIARLLENMKWVAIYKVAEELIGRLGDLLGTILERMFAVRRRATPTSNPVSE